MMPMSVIINDVTVYYTLPDGAVSLELPSKKISDVIANSTSKIPIDLSEITVAENVILPISALRAFANADLIVEITLPQGAVTFGRAALVNIVTAAQGNNITVSIKLVDIMNLSATQRAVVSGGSAYELTVHDGFSLISDFDALVEVILPYELKADENPDTVVVYWGGADGSIQIAKNCQYLDGKIVFTTTHFSLKMIGHNPILFNDIDNHWARSPIIQAGARELVSGYCDNSFRPDEYITRAEFVQLIYNLLDFPTNVLSGLLAYNDVTSDMWHFAAIAVLKDIGLLDGIAYPDGTFLPDNPITRQEMADVLTKHAVYKGIEPIKNVRATIFADFIDIHETSVYAVEHAINVGFLSEDGMGDSTFSPDGYTTRAQAVTTQSAIIRILGRL
jgi:hypothetical protein